MRYESVTWTFALTVFLISAGSVWAVPPPDNLLMRITALEEEVTVLEEGFDTILPHTLPVGAIMAWSGSVYTLPEGWALCDGQNGTPDLRDRFIVGAGDDVDVGETGGSSDHEHGSMTHDHSMATPPHNHAIAPWEGDTEMAGEHTHFIGETTADGTEIAMDLGGRGVAGAGHRHEDYAEQGLHSHYLRITERTSSDGEGLALTTPSSPGSDSADHMPLHYKLAFIVKLPPQDAASVEADRPTRNPLARILALEAEVAQLAPALDSLVPYQVPSALIVAWSGSPTGLPEGWFLCDGSNGTPDLGDKYIRGAATNEDIGEVAGAASHMHGLESHRHEATTPPHPHAIASWAGFTRSVGPHTHTHDIGDDVFAKKGNDDFLGVTDRHLHPIGEAGAHAHELVFPQGVTSQDSGTGWTELNMSDIAAATSLPLYYKLAFIQKAPNAGIVMNSAPITTTPDPITRIEMLEEAVSALSTHLILTRPFLVPGGAVGLWSGSLNALPAGWVLSDGTNGTLDLRDRFILGTVDSAGLEGGIQTHEHVLASHTHTVSFPHGHPNNSIEIATETRAETRHGHLTSLPIGDSESADIGGLGDYVSLSYWRHVHDLQDSDAHEHYVELNDNILAVDEGLKAETAPATNTTSQADNLPPYYKLAFIVKLLENGD